MSDRLKTIEAQAALAGCELRTAYVLTNQGATVWFCDLDGVQAALDAMAEPCPPCVPATCTCLTTK